MKDEDVSCVRHSVLVKMPYFTCTVTEEELISFQMPHEISPKEMTMITKIQLEFPRSNIEIGWDEKDVA